MDRLPAGYAGLTAPPRKVEPRPCAGPGNMGSATAKACRQRAQRIGTHRYLGQCTPQGSRCSERPRSNPGLFRAAAIAQRDNRILFLFLLGGRLSSRYGFRMRHGKGSLGAPWRRNPAGRPNPSPPATGPGHITVRQDAARQWREEHPRTLALAGAVEIHHVI